MALKGENVFELFLEEGPKEAFDLRVVQEILRQTFAKTGPWAPGRGAPRAGCAQAGGDHMEGLHSTARVCRQLGWQLLITDKRLSGTGTGDELRRLSAASQACGGPIRSRSPAGEYGQAAVSRVRV